MAKLVEVTVARPHLGKTTEFLEMCAKFKKMVMAAGVEEVWFNTGNVGMKRVGNEDAYLIFPEKQFYIVSDGMGLRIAYLS